MSVQWVYTPPGQAINRHGGHPAVLHQAPSGCRRASRNG